MTDVSQSSLMDYLPEQLWYLYGFHLQDKQRNIELTGIDDQYPVEPYHHLGLTAYVSRVNTSQFVGENAENHLQDIAWVTQKAQSHQQILQALMQFDSLFPVPLGTIFSSLDKLATRMTYKRKQISETLQALRGCQEWGVQLSLNRSVAIEAKMKEMMQDQAIESLSPGHRHLQQQRLKRQAAKEIDAWLFPFTELLLGDLNTLCESFYDRKRLIQEDLLCNWAFLLTDEQQAVFFDRVNDWQEKWQEYGLHIKVKGPWPAYSFCANIE